MYTIYVAYKQRESTKKKKKKTLVYTLVLTFGILWCSKMHNFQAFKKCQFRTEHICCFLR